MSKQPQTEQSTSGVREPLVRFALWAGAIALAIGTLILHKTIGPGDATRGSFEFGKVSQTYQLPRGWELSAGGARIELRLDGNPPEIEGAVLWRPHPTDDPYAATAFREIRRRVTTPGEGTRSWTELAARLPALPAGEFMEYFVTLQSEGREIRLPAGKETVILQYRGFVRPEILYAYLAGLGFMLVVGMRSGLSAIFEPATTRRYAWGTFFLLTLAGMVLGSLVQYYALGESWSGVSLGVDWENNRVLAAWGIWLAACLILGRSTKPVTMLGRIAVLAAVIVTATLYPFPNNLLELIDL